MMKKMLTIGVLSAGLLLGVQAANAAGIDELKDMYPQGVWSGSAEFVLETGAKCNYSAQGYFFTADFRQGDVSFNADLKKTAGGNVCPAGLRLNPLGEVYDAPYYQLNDGLGLGSIAGTVDGNMLNMSGSWILLTNNETKTGYQYQQPIPAKLILKMRN